MLRTRYILLILALLGTGLAREARANYGWTFTYQGELKEGGTLVDGTADLSFRLLADAAGTQQVGPTIVLNDHPVTEGKFTAPLDFTNGGTLPGIFDGLDRWLEVTVNGTTLLPRQQLTATPHAAVSSLLQMPYAETTTASQAFTLVTDYPGSGAVAIRGIATSADSSAVGVYGEASAVGTLNNAGVVGRSYSANGIGVIGANGSTTGNCSGVYGSAESPSGIGVLGWANSPAGETRGVLGRVESSSGHAGYFEGRGYFSGHLGVGTTSPGYRVHAVDTGTGRLAIAGDCASPFGTYLSLFNHGGGSTWHLISTGSSNSEGAGNLLVANGDETRVTVADSFVGIGRSTQITSAEAFGVNSPATSGNFGGMYVNTDGAAGRPFYGYATAGGGADAYHYYDGIVATWKLWCGADRLTVERTSGEVGIGTTSPQYLLHVDGSAGKPGGGSWTNSSDRRLKKNIADLDGALGRLLRLRGVTYEYIDPQAIHELPGTQIGMIAQEVEAVFPEWVDEGENGMKRVTFRGFEALTVEALRELQAEKDTELAEQAAEVAEQAMAIATQAQRIALLETALAERDARIVTLEQSMEAAIEDAKARSDEAHARLAALEVRLESPGAGTSAARSAQASVVRP